jgi:hypothetical protein
LSRRGGHRCRRSRSRRFWGLGSGSGLRCLRDDGWGRWLRRFQLRRLGLRSGLCRRLFLELGELLVLELEQLLQVGHVLFQVAHTRLRFLQGALARRGIVSASRAGTRCAGLCRVGLREAQLILCGGLRRGLGTGFDPAAHGTLARRRLGRGRLGGKAGAVLVPLGAVRLHQPVRVFRAHPTRLFGRGQAEDAAGAHQVDVFADERVLVGAIKRNQHLVEAYARRQIRARDRSQRVATPHLVRCPCGPGQGQRLSRGGGRRLSRGGLLRRRERPGLRVGGAGGPGGGRGRLHRHCARGCGGGCSRGCGNSPRVLVARGVEQERVFPHETAAARLQLHQKVDERLVDRLRGSHADDRLSIAPGDGKSHGRQGGARLDSGLAERLRGSDAGGQPVLLSRLQCDDLDFGVERRPEAGHDRQAAQACCLQGKRHRQRQRGRQFRYADCPHLFPSPSVGLLRLDQLP